jgi:PHD/YefM family antitoxin component YafN of YafNO toxin-antitoxin module
MIDTIIPIQEIKRRGMTAVDGGLKRHGAVTIVRNNRPAYVVISPKEYAELIQAADEARIAMSLADWREGRCKVATADEIMREATADE